MTGQGTTPRAPSPLPWPLAVISFKANTRNLKLLDAHLSQPRAARRADTCFLCGVFFVVGGQCG